ncbi:MAG: hypothetical protein CMD01_02810, partial [Flavobacteriales bacterium]|nr:hypothetical protein [Flavobacteriales bacterium]
MYNPYMKKIISYFLYKSTATILFLGALFFYVNTIAQPVNCGGVLTIEPYVVSNPAFNGQDISCGGASDGEVCVNVLAGTGSYSYQWVGGPLTQCYSGVDAGTYTVIVTDLGSGEVCFANIQVNEPAPLTVFTFSITPPTCNTNCDGSGSAIIIGGTAPVDYLWGSGETGFLASSLCVGSNQLTVTDANGCTFDTIFAISTPTPIYPNVDVDSVSCFSFCDGSAESFPSGGNGTPYQFSWVDNSSSLEVSTLSSASGLCAGSYTVTVTDPNLCSDDTTVIIESPTEIVISTVSSDDALCSYSCDGSTTVSASGGTTPYISVEWFDGIIGTGLSTGVTGFTNNTL